MEHVHNNNIDFLGPDFHQRCCSLVDRKYTICGGYPVLVQLTAENSFTPDLVGMWSVQCDCDYDVRPYPTPEEAWAAWDAEQIAQRANNPNAFKNPVFKQRSKKVEENKSDNQNDEKDAPAVIPVDLGPNPLKGSLRPQTIQPPPEEPKPVTDVLQCAFYVVDYGDGMEAGIGVPKQGLQGLEYFKEWRDDKPRPWSLTTDSTTRMVLRGMSITMLPPEFPEGEITEALRSFEHCIASLNSGIVGIEVHSQLIPHRAYPIASLPRTFDKLDFQGSAFLELELEPGTDAPLHVEVPSRTVRADQKGYTTSKADGGPVESIPACYVWGGIISLHIWEERRQYADKPEPATAPVPPPANEVERSRFFIVDTGDSLAAYLGHCKPGYQPLAEAEAATRERRRFSLYTASTDSYSLLQGIQVTLDPPPKLVAEGGLKSFNACAAALVGGAAVVLEADVTPNYWPSWESHKGEPITQRVCRWPVADLGLRVLAAKDKTTEEQIVKVLPSGFVGASFQPMIIGSGSSYYVDIEIPSVDVVEGKYYNQNAQRMCFVWTGMLAVYRHTKRRSDEAQPEDYMIANDPGATARDLAGLVNSPSTVIRSTVAGHPNTPTQILEMLAADRDPVVCLMVAGNKNIPSGLRGQAVAAARKALGLGEVPPSSSKQPAAATHIKSAGEPDGLDPDIDNMALDQLASSDDWELRWEVAQHPNTSQITLGGLSVDDNEEVRLAVAQNPNTEAGILVTMAEQDRGYIASAAQKNPNYPFPPRMMAKAKRNRRRREHRNEVKERLDRLEREVDSLKCRQPERPRCSRCGKPMEG